MYFLNPYYAGKAKSPYAQVHDVKHGGEGNFIRAIECPACGGHLRSGYFSSNRLILKNGLLPDMLYFNGCYVSERFRSAWEAEGLKGIEAFVCVDEVKMLGNGLRVDEKYYLLVPAVSGVQLDIAKSRCVSSSAVIRDMDAYLEDIAKRRVVCEACGRVRLRLRSGTLWCPSWKYPETWALRGRVENDISTLTNDPGLCILSERFIAFVRKYKLTNVYALTEEELRLAQDDVGGQSAFTPVCLDPDAAEMPRKKPKKSWRNTGSGSIRCAAGRFIIRDVLDDDEAFCVEVRAQNGLWSIDFMEENAPCGTNRCVLLRCEESDAVPSKEIGTLSLDAGAFYIRACGRDERAEKRIREALMDMGQSPELEHVKKMAVSARRVVAAAFLLADVGDGEYKVYADHAEEAGAIKIEMGKNQ